MAEAEDDIKPSQNILEKLDLNSYKTQSEPFSNFNPESRKVAQNILRESSENPSSQHFQFQFKFRCERIGKQKALHQRKASTEANFAAFTTCDSVCLSFKCCTCGKVKKKHFRVVEGRSTVWILPSGTCLSVKSIQGKIHKKLSNIHAALVRSTSYAASSLGRLPADPGARTFSLTSCWDIKAGSLYDTESCRSVDTLA